MQKIPTTDLSLVQRTKVVELLDDDKLIAAVAYIRQCIECSLAEANDLRKRIAQDAVDIRYEASKPKSRC